MDYLTTFNNTISQISHGGTIENWAGSHTPEGHKMLELQFYYPDGTRSFFIAIDNGVTQQKRQINVYAGTSMIDRNNEIKRLYFNEGMTQNFIGKIFRLSQGRISDIIRDK